MNETLDKRVTDLINVQVPEFIREDHPEFVTFMSAYYEWLETKFNKVLVEPTDGITIRFHVDTLTSEHQIIIDNLSFDQSISIFSYLDVGSNMITNARYKENRGPWQVSRKELFQLQGNITSISDGGADTILLEAPEHDLGFYGKQISLFIIGTSYDGLYDAIVVDDNYLRINGIYLSGLDETGIWQKNYIFISTDNNISEEVLKPNNKKTIFSYANLGGNVISANVHDHGLTNLSTIIIVDGTKYLGTHSIMVIDEDHVSFSATWDGTETSAYVTVKELIKEFKEYPEQQGNNLTTVVWDHHGLSYGSIITIVDSPNYLGDFTVSKILSDNEFEIPTSYIAEDVEITHAAIVLSQDIGPTLTEDANWLGAIYTSKNMLPYSDVDETINAFMNFFMKEFLVNIPVSILCDKALLLKNIKMFYKSRGTEKSWKLLFRILFDAAVDFYYPSLDIFIPDSGAWVEDRSIIVKLLTNRNNQLFDPNQIYLTKRIVGQSSSATGVVGEIRKHWNGTQFVYELMFEKNTITGEFEPWESIAISLTDDNNRATIQPILADIVLDPLYQGLGYTTLDSTIFVNIPVAFQSFVKMEAAINELLPNGEIASISILNHSLGYPVFPALGADLPTVTFVDKGVNTAQATCVLGALIKYDGFYATQDGFVDNIKKLRDDYYYQEFSYVVKTAGVSMNFFKSIAKKLVHPAGLKMFCRVLLESVLNTAKAKPATRNPRYNEEMVPFGGTVFGIPRSMIAIDDNTVQIKLNYFNLNTLVGKKIVSYIKTSPALTSTTTITANDENIITTSGALFTDCDVVHIKDIVTTTDEIESVLPDINNNALLKSRKHNLGEAGTIISNVTISGTTNYDGTYSVVIVDEDNFFINVPYVDDDTGTWSYSYDIDAGNKEYPGVRLDDTHFKVTERLWSDNYLSDNNLLLHSYIYSKKQLFSGSLSSQTVFDVTGASLPADSLIGKIAFLFEEGEYEFGSYSQIDDNTSSQITLSDSILIPANRIIIFHNSGQFSKILGNTFIEDNIITLQEPIYQDSDTIRIYKVQEKIVQQDIVNIDPEPANVDNRLQTIELNLTCQMSLAMPYTGIYRVGEVVYQLVNDAEAIVTSYDSGTGILELSKVVGIFDLTHRVIGEASGASRIILSIPDSNLIPHKFYTFATPEVRRSFSDIQIRSLKNIREIHVSSGSNNRTLWRSLQHALPLPQDWTYYEPYPSDELARWFNGVSASNGMIYGIPFSSTVILKINPELDSTSSFGSISGINKWAGGVLDPVSGMIYGMPYQATTILKIDPSNDTYTTFGSFDSSDGKYAGGVLAPNGKIYALPRTATAVLKIDPSNDTYTTFGSFSSDIKWIGCVLASNGKIYGIPAGSATVLEIDPSDDSITTFGSLGTASYKWRDGVLDPVSGMIYGIPARSDQVLQIDPIGQTAIPFGSLGGFGFGKWAGGILAPNGMIYGMPYGHNNILKIDPNTVTATIITMNDLGAVYAKWFGGVLASNNMIYGIPFNANKVLKLDPFDDMASLISNRFPTYQSTMEEHVPSYIERDSAQLHSPSVYSGTRLDSHTFQASGTPFTADLITGYSVYSYFSGNRNKGAFSIVSTNTNNTIITTEDSLYPDCDTIEITAIPFYQHYKDLLEIEKFSGNMIDGDIATSFPGIFNLRSTGGVLAPNGMIYGIPYNGENILKFDPKTDISTVFGSLSSGGSKWRFGVLAPNGMIYGIPYNSTEILKIDPSNDSFTTFDNGTPLTGTGKWGGGILAPNGIIYGIPINSTTVLRIDPSDDSFTTFGSLSGDASKWNRAVLAPNGMIYGIPLNSTEVLKIDPNTDTATTFGSLPGTQKWAGGVLAPNGMIYGIPSTSTEVLKIDPTSDTISTFGSLGSSTAKWAGGVLAPNGMIYGMPSISSKILKIDPINDTATLVNTSDFGLRGGKWVFGVLAQNNMIYGMQSNSPNILKIDANNNAVFQITSPDLIPNQLVGLKVYSYNLTNPSNRFQSTIISNTEDTIKLDGQLFPGCDTIEIILSGLNNYWSKYANMSIGEFSNYKISDFIDKLPDKTIICPESRIYQTSS